VPCSHPVVERLIGTVRREYLDRLLFWTAADLERKLVEFQQYYNEHRTHAGRAGRPRRRARTRLALRRVSGRIGGRRTVVGCITRRGPRDAVDPQRVHCSDLRIRHSQAAGWIICAARNAGGRMTTQCSINWPTSFAIGVTKKRSGCCNLTFLQLCKGANSSHLSGRLPHLLLKRWPRTVFRLKRLRLTP